MLISMPTGTSTIFGAFQAILALHIGTGRLPPSGYKLLRKEKFASEIFRVCAAVVYAATQPELHRFVRLDVKPMLDQEFHDRPQRPTGGRAIRKLLRFANNNL
jgi:hypothetical protein